MQTVSIRSVQSFFGSLVNLLDKTDQDSANAIRNIQRQLNNGEISRFTDIFTIVNEIFRKHDRMSFTPDEILGSTMNNLVKRATAFNAVLAMETTWKDILSSE